MDVTVVVPTVLGRGEHLERCLAGYFAEPVDVRVEAGWPCCGDAWNAAAAASDTPYLHFSADDLEPLPGWLGAARQCVDSGRIPAPVVNGIPGVFALVPFLSRAMWDQIGPVPAGLHYYTDNWVTDRGRDLGFETVPCAGYRFIHCPAMAGRLDRMTADHERYVRELDRARA